jgi:DNA polymerase I-like protein with 3'-5' exonuclease and polymerase domains
LIVAINIEANGLKPDKIWCVVCKDIDTGEIYRFNNLTTDDTERNRFNVFARSVTYWIGHNFLGYDYPVLCAHNLLCDPDIARHCTDTLVISKLADYPRKGHSVEHYAEEFGDGRQSQVSYREWSPELLLYCERKVDLAHKIYLKYLRYIENPKYLKSIELEQQFQLVCNNLSDNGFSFNVHKAEGLLTKVTEELKVLDQKITDAFPPRLKLIREVNPKETKYGTISRSSIPKLLREDIPSLTVGAPFSYCHWVDFNPSSHKQIIEVLNQAGWRPIEKTKTHIDVERELSKLKHTKRSAELDLRLTELYTKLNNLKTSGWKINEANLETLPPSAPLAARLLAKRILLESRRRTLTEWLALVGPDQRVHGKFYGIGAWTHRMAHQNPNTANIPNAVKVSDGSKILYGKELRALWQAPKNRLLVGVDAEAIQLRVFAHLINDPNLTNAIVNGKKSDGTDPHSLNKKYFGSFCKTRNAAKHSLYAMFFGGGPGKIAEIMSCTKEEAEEAIASLIEKYPGLEHLQKKVFPLDAQRGYFIGLDGRAVRIPGDTVSNRKHLCMSGYLQNGEAVIMKSATLKWIDKLKEYDALLVNFVHDEWQIECPNNMAIALEIGEMVSQSLVTTGLDLNLNCPMAGSYYNDDDRDYTIATNWSKTH